jgi:hypothetical protein
MGGMGSPNWSVAVCVKLDLSYSLSCSCRFCLPVVGFVFQLSVLSFVVGLSYSQFSYVCLTVLPVCLTVRLTVVAFVYSCAFVLQLLYPLITKLLALANPAALAHDRSSDRDRSKLPRATHTVEGRSTIPQAYRWGLIEFNETK